MLRIRNVYPGSRIWIFFHTGSRNGTKLSEIWSGWLFRIPDPDYFQSRIRIQGSKITDSRTWISNTAKMWQNWQQKRSAQAKNEQAWIWMAELDYNSVSSYPSLTAVQLNRRIVAMPRSVSSPSTWIVLGRGFIPPADRGLEEKILWEQLKKCMARTRTPKKNSTFAPGTMKWVMSRAKTIYNIKITAMFRIRDILVRIRIRGSVPLTNVSGSRSYSFHQWPSGRQ